MNKINCVCGKTAKQKDFNVQGFQVKGWQCPSCKRIEYSDDINKVLVIRKLQKNPIIAKIGILGESKIVRLPKQLDEIMLIKKGELVEIYPESLTKIAIEVKSQTA
ncbi:MAG: hypothetical protein COT15_02250 [Candidatus Diapherotrites archaeon CG08_land_8_20_14_0_20_34_12]|nr:MAG: hypothetical protein COT15_02250 [Candidatus Diapherotrites archaeon CG08_land_8_20_14_0_20_34_12]